MEIIVENLHVTSTWEFHLPLRESRAQIFPRKTRLNALHQIGFVRKSVGLVVFFSCFYFPTVRTLRYMLCTFVCENTVFFILDL